MTTTTETSPAVTTDGTVPAAADAGRTVPLSAILEFERETEALGDVLGAAADAEDLAGDPGCPECVGEELARLLTDPSADVSASFAAEARLANVASNPQCSCPPGEDEPCSALCSVPQCQAAYSVHMGG